MKTTEILVKSKLRKTPLREEVVKLFIDNQKSAFSEQEINEMFGSSFDRVSVYRTIRTFLEKMIIHKIVCEDGILKYALSKENEGGHHPHFECTSCHTVSCITNTEIQKVNVPRGYAPKEVQFLIQGLCPKCRQ